MNPEVSGLEPQSKKEVKTEGHKIQLKFCFKNKRKAFKKHAHIVQGEPFSWGVKIKNIDNKPTPPSKIVLGHIQDLNEKFFQSMEEEELFVRALNPGEEIYVNVDTTTIFLEGMQWAQIDIIPNDKNVHFETYQFDDHHQLIKLYSNCEEDENSWMDTIYIQKKMELLQSRTNNYILLLTALTVWESLFGIKATVKNFFEIISLGLLKVSAFIAWCLKFIQQDIEADKL